MFYKAKKCLIQICEYLYKLWESRVENEQIIHSYKYCCKR